MSSSVSIICVNDGHEVALQYADLLDRAGISIVVNFPSSNDYPVANTGDGLISKDTSVVLLIVTLGWVRLAKSNSNFISDSGIMQKLFSYANGVDGQSFIPIIADSNVENIILNRKHWLRGIPYELDNAVSRMDVIQRILSLVSSVDRHKNYDVFEGIETIISTAEQSSSVEKMTEVRESADRVAYDIYKCTHRIRNTIIYYVYFCKGITIANTESHIKDNYPFVLTDGTFWLLNHEPGQIRLDDRVKNIKRVFKTQNVTYVEDFVSQLLVMYSASNTVSENRSYLSDFIEPQVRSGLLNEKDSNNHSFDIVIDWLKGSIAGVLVLEGQGGIGKTEVMRDLRKRIETGKIEFNKVVERTVLFLASGDITRPGSSLQEVSDNISLYDLYLASALRSSGDGNRDIYLNRETFFNALELGNLIVFVDGLDEIIARYRSAFNPDYFFSELQKRMHGDSSCKIIISCRNVFFDQNEYQMVYPCVQSYEILAFDEILRNRYFEENIKGMPRRVKKAIALSENLAQLSDKRYVPFVLSLITDIMREEGDVEARDEIDADGIKFISHRLNEKDYSDRVVGQFCEREKTIKVRDTALSLTVDQQVDVFIEIARRHDSNAGRVDAKCLSQIIMDVTGSKEVGKIADVFMSHPFLSVTNIPEGVVIDLKFDFLPEYFLMLDAYEALTTDRTLVKQDILIFNKYCTANSMFCRGIVERIEKDDDVFGMALINYHANGEALILTEFVEDDKDILMPTSALSQFSFSLITLLAKYELDDGHLNNERFNVMLRNIFSSHGEVLRMSVMDIFIHDDKRFKIKLDFRGLKLKECLFHSVDIGNCMYDLETEFRDCRFIKCSGNFPKASGITRETFIDCHMDEEFEQKFSSAERRMEEQIESIKADVTSFVLDFYSSGEFKSYTKDFVERHYKKSNPRVPFKKMYKIMTELEIIEEVPDKQKRVYISINRKSVKAVERLAGNGVLAGALQDATTILSKEN